MGNECVTVEPWGLQTGDRILGTSLVVKSIPMEWRGDVGGNKERAKFTYLLDHDGVEKEITYNGESTVRVIRNMTHMNELPI